MGVSDRIEAFITELLKSDDDWVELKRNELAAVFNCVPSQINYVIATRFNAEQGYAVESRRGGGGYLRIKRLDATKENPIFSVIQSVGDAIDLKTAKSCIIRLRDMGVIAPLTAKVILAAVDDRAICTEQSSKDRVRAGVLKNTLAALL